MSHEVSRNVMTLAISKGQTDILLSLCIKLASLEVITKVMYAVGSCSEIPLKCLGREAILFLTWVVERE